MLDKLVSAFSVITGISEWSQRRYSRQKDRQQVLLDGNLARIPFHAVRQNRRAGQYEIRGYGILDIGDEQYQRAKSERLGFEAVDSTAAGDDIRQYSFLRFLPSA